MASKLTVYTWDTFSDEEQKEYVYEGDVDANISPNGELLIVENMKLSDERVIRAIFNKGAWERVEVE